MPQQNQPEQNQPITTLPIKTASGLAATDYLLGIDSAEGYQMLIQDLGDYIIQHATSSLAGQSQTLANAISALSTKMFGETWDIPIIADMDTPDNGYSLRKWNSTTIHRPDESDGLVFTIRTGNYGTQYAFQRAFNSFYIRTYVGGTWSAWTIAPRRSEINALNSKPYFRPGTNATILDFPDSANNQYHLTFNTAGAIMYDANWSVLWSYDPQCTDYNSDGHYHVRVCKLGKMVVVSGVVFGTGTAGYLYDVPLPSPANYEADSSEKLGNAIVFYARNQNTGSVIQLRCGGNFNIFLEAAMTNGQAYSFGFSYCRA